MTHEEQIEEAKRFALGMFDTHKRVITPNEEYEDIIRSRDTYNYAKPAASSSETNAAKYGQQSDDVIAQQYKESRIGGNYFCKGNIDLYTIILNNNCTKNYNTPCCSNKDSTCCQHT